MTTDNITNDLTLEHDEPKFNLKLGRSLFSDPVRDKSNCIVVANVNDIVAGISVGDLVRIDFTQNTIGSDGLYVITLNDGWIGYRFFDRAPMLRIVDDEQPILVTPEMMKTIKVVGKVKDIYRSVNK